MPDLQDQVSIEAASSRIKLKVHCLKWSEEQSQWLQEGFSEHIAISRLADENIVTIKEGKGLQGFIATLTTSSTFEAHPVFRIQKTNGSIPDDGAFMVIINILGLDDSGEHILHKPSNPFALVFHINTQENFGLMALSEALKVAPEIQLNDYNRIDTLFDWAELQFNHLFPHFADSRFISGFYARCYQNGVCVGIKDNHIFAVGGEFGINIVKLGEFDVVTTQVGL